MTKRFKLDTDEQILFRKTVADAKPIYQDTVIPFKPRRKVMTLCSRYLLQEPVDTSFYFSDEYQTLLNSNGPTSYIRSDTSPYEVKKLRRGDYTPELFLDLHGLTQAEAKKELGSLIIACGLEQVHCACVMHGYGKHILKYQTPLWLAQHPDVLCFHQAPKNFGGSAALLVLIELDY